VTRASELTPGKTSKEGIGVNADTRLCANPEPVRLKPAIISSGFPLGKLLCLERTDRLRVPPLSTHDHAFGDNTLVAD